MLQSLLSTSPSAIHPSNRAQLLNDLFSLAALSSSMDTGIVTTYEQAFDTSLYLANGEEYLPFGAAMR